MTIKDRIDDFIAYKNIRRSAFEKKCGFSNGYTRNLKANPSSNKIEDILKAYPELDRVWLLTGEGAMLRDASGETPDTLSPEGDAGKGVIWVDYVSVAARAAYIECLRDGEEWPEKYPVAPMGNERRDATRLRVFEVGDAAMADRIPAGSLVLAKEIPEAAWRSAEGTVVAVDTGDPGEVLVRWMERNCLLIDGTIRLKAENPAFGETAVKASDLLALHKAKRAVSLPIR